MPSKHQKWRAARLRCPVCSQNLNFDGQGGLVDSQGHRFDISSKGYVNFLSRKPGLGETYTKSFFSHRRRVFEAGFYDGLISAIQTITARLKLQTALDAGCGEGFFARSLLKMPSPPQIYALDISKDAVALACSGVRDDIFWMTADLANIPVQSGEIDLLFNILSPANYGEFARVLSKGGLIVKVVPGPSYFRELREVLGKKRPPNTEAAEYFSNHCEVAGREHVFHTFEVGEGLRESLFAMSPISFGEALNHAPPLKSITIDLDILIGRPK